MPGPTGHRPTGHGPTAHEPVGPNNCSKKFLFLEAVRWLRKQRFHNSPGELDRPRSLRRGLVTAWRNPPLFLWSIGGYLTAGLCCGT